MFVYVSGRPETPQGDQRSLKEKLDNDSLLSFESVIPQGDQRRLKAM